MNRHRAGALLASIALALSPLLVGLPTASAATAPLGPVRVAVTNVNPPSPGPGDTFVLAGRAVNAGTVAIPSVSVRLRIDPVALTSRDALSEAASGTFDEDPTQADTIGQSVDSSVVQDLSESLAPGASVPFRISMPADDFHLTDFGVHSLIVEVRGLDADGGRVTLGAVRTFLVWRGSGSVPTVRVTWMVPLQDVPLRDQNGQYASPGAATLADSFDAGGRLSSIVAAGAGEPVTWAVDPDLLEEASALAGGVPLIGGGTTTPDAGAATWLAALKAATEVRALPYADPDLTAQRRAALGSDLPAEVSTGIAAASTVLGRAISAAPAWPVDGVTTQGTVSGVTAAGLDQVVLSSSAVRTPEGETATPDALGTLTGSTVQVIAADDTLSTLAATDPRLLGNNTLARLRLMAETAMVAAERPNDPRSVVIALPRNWSPPATWARALLTMDKVAPWIVPTSLTSLTADPGDAPARRLAPYPASEQAAEVSSPQLTVVRQTASRLNRFDQILTNPDEYVPAYTSALQRGESAAWRTDAAGGPAYVESVAKALLDVTRKVKFGPRGEVTLSSRTGKIPLSVRNGLDQDIRISVELTATPAFRLRMGKETVSTIPAGRTSSVEVPASTSADGRIPVQARLATPAGDSFGTPVTFEVRATGYGEVARLVAGALVVLLGVALVVRVVRRIRAGAAAADAARDILAEQTEKQ